MTGQRNRMFQHVRDGTSDHHITCKSSIDDARAVPLQLPAGGVNFFAYDVPHATRSNTTPNARAGVAYHFLRSDCFLDRQFPLPEEAEWKTPIVAGKDAQGGAEAYGRPVEPFCQVVRDELRNET